MNKHTSIMWDYIAQEPETLAQLFHSDQTEKYAEKFGSSIKTVYFVAHGSSYNAASTVADYFGQYAGIKVFAYTPGHFCDGLSGIKLEDRESTVVAVISQTGTSAGAIEALDYSKPLGFRTLSFTDVAGSPVETKADSCLHIMCGREDSNAKTKGYSGTLLLLMLLALSLGKTNGTLSEEKYAELRTELTAMVAEIPALTQQLKTWAEENEFGKDLKDLYVLGSGMNYGTSFEGQLKLMETMCIPTMFNDIGEFSHGMHRSVYENSSVLLICTPGKQEELMRQSFTYLQGITKHVWMIDIGAKTSNAHSIAVPAFEHCQSVLLSTLVIQVLSVFAPEYNGKDPNRDAHNDFTDYVGTRVDQR